MKFLLNITIILIITLVLLWLLFWLFSHKKFDVEYGISFNQNHATDLGLDWKQVYTDMLDELHPDYIRIASMWSEVEKVQGTYDFSDVDWMMNMAMKKGTRVLLVVGQKAPRWPECHVPAWLRDVESADVRRDALLSYVQETVLRYKKHSALDLWQVENEAFIGFAFGECDMFDDQAIYDELSLVRERDPDRKIVLTDSGELSTWRKPSSLGDIFGTTVYRIVRTPGGHRFSYGFLPAGFYRLKARVLGNVYDQFFVSELQAEPWFADTHPQNTSTETMEETMDPARLEAHLDYASRVGASRVYLWGVEWWYYMKQERNDSRYWDIVKSLHTHIQ
jgi:hypothetical protein